MHKYKSIAYTVIPTTVTTHYEVEHYTIDTDTVEYLVKEYTGNTELCYTRTDTLSQRIFNSIGYYSDSTYYHYIKDHLGNICAVHPRRRQDLHPPRAAGGIRLE